jgi:hypothetical protein
MEDLDPGGQSSNSDVFSFGVTLFALATNGLVPWHQAMSLCNFESVLRDCGGCHEFIKNQQQQREEEGEEEGYEKECGGHLQHRILDDDSGCIFIAGPEKGVIPPTSTITDLAWQYGSPNTTVYGHTSHVTRHTSHVTRHTSHVTLPPSDLLLRPQVITIWPPHAHQPCAMHCKPTEDAR